MKLSIMSVTRAGVLLLALSASLVSTVAVASELNIDAQEASRLLGTTSARRVAPAPAVKPKPDAPVAAAPRKPRVTKPKPEVPSTEPSVPVGTSPSSPVDVGPSPIEQQPPESGKVSLDACFSPEGGCDKKLIAFISGAKKTLQIAIYSITHDGISGAIIDAKKRGVSVRMVADRSQSKGKSSQVDALVSAGIELKIGNFSGIMHDKFTIVDGEFMETGSYNYTGNATNNNGENQLYLNDKSIIQRYSDNFEQMFKNALAN